ncbi:MAG TPA: hypothetical protein VGD92_11420, partial [Sphingobacteriaceae bacterium]
DAERIPNVPVNFRASLNDPALSRLTTPGGAVIVSGHGVAGLILYRRPDGQYMAFDRCSPVNPEQRCAVNLDDPNLTATDPCSGAVFSLFDGAPMKAPAKKPLKQYEVTIRGFELTVMN